MDNQKTIKQQFTSSLKRGTGEAYLILKDNPNIDFSASIIKALRKNYAFDGQAEGTRALYLSELISLSKQQKKIRKAILNGLATEQEDTWTLSQLFDIAALFAKKGDTEARKGIYNRFYKNPIDHSGWVGEDAILEIDGIEGLKYIAEVKGKAILSNPEEWENSWVVEGFQKENPSIDVYKELKRASKKNAFIKAYLDSIKKHKEKIQKRERPRYDYQVVTEKINSKATVPLPPAGAKELSKEDIQKLANDFLKESNLEKLEKYMRVFDRVKYPYSDYQPILKLAKSKYRKNDNNLLIENASGALKYFKGQDIRDFAIEKLKAIKIPEAYLDLLVSNYKKGDHKLLTEIANRCKDEDDVHSIVYGYINIYKANSTKECKEPLEAIYNKLTCGIHRTDIVKILIENKVLSKQLKAEIKHDSSEETRLLLK